jgi:ParB family transcriptional regulator, chromosome partitioning protein
MKEAKKRLGKGLSSLLSDSRIQDLDQMKSAGDLEKVSMTQVRSKPGDSENPSAGESDSQAAGSQGRRTGSVTDRLTAGVSVSSLPVDKVLRNPHQPRQNWDETKLIELAESIKKNGLIQPILVRQMGNSYQLIAGERRLRAMKLAGKSSIPSIIRHATEEQMIEWALVENIHRADLSPIERAKAYDHYQKLFKLNQEEIAAKMGEDRATVANYLRLLDMTPAEQNLIAEGSLTMGHAKALMGIADDQLRAEFAKVVVLRKYSVRETERRIYEIKTPPPRKRQETQLHIRALEEDFSRVLGTKVTIKTTGRRGHRGRVIMEFYTLNDFDRIKEHFGI